MKRLQLYNVAPSLPKEIRFLETLSANLWWCWNVEAIELFRRIEPHLWRETGHNPLEFLSRIPQERYEQLAKDHGFVDHLEGLKARFEEEIGAEGVGAKAHNGPCIAYFSLEYGIHESITVYSGGLGVLAADHLKSASDLQLPLVAVGLMYRQGYFQQYLNNDGWQQEKYPENEIHRLPLKKACNADGAQIEVSLPLPEGTLRAVVWQLDMGCVPLYLLDANIPANPPEFRRITAKLYPGDRQTRLRQELLLGMAGFKALMALGYNPVTSHMNEGHAAFLALARIVHLSRDAGLDLEAAKEVVRQTSVFTTHTPVPAGNETFKTDLLVPHLEALRGETQLDPKTVLAWGRRPGAGTGEDFCMTIVGLRFGAHSNGVSALHGAVERRMWSHLWPDYPDDEIPIGHVTNGIHVRTWLSRENAALYERYLGSFWRTNPSDKRVPAGIDQIPGEELWRVHEVNRSRLIRATRELLEKQIRVRNATQSEIAQARSALEHDVLTIGFARRFAAYKRATLLLKDPARLEALLTDEERPVQLVFAGKAHPADDHGKDLIRQIVQFAHNPRMRKRVVFLENYDVMISRYMVQGVDVWLNTPRRPQEASGTSGMKASANGGLHVSILDGWWDEGFSPDCGWAIGHGEEYDDDAYQDSVESQALYNILENEVVPRFYERQDGEIPVNWIKMMKASIKMSLGYFTSHRMVSEYNEAFYGKALAAYERLTADNAAAAHRFVEQQKRFAELWPQVSVEFPECDRDISALHVGDAFNLSTTAHLGELKPEEVSVQVYYGPVDSENRIRKTLVEDMSIVEPKADGASVCRCSISCRETGRYGFTARVVPKGTEWKGLMPGFITWANHS